MFDFDLSPDIERYVLDTPICREYDIIGHLQKKGRLPVDALKTPLSLYRCHFLVFNGLYRLQLQTHVHKNYQLMISPLRIEVLPYDEWDGDSTNINQHDALSHFYLDYQHVAQMDEQDVNQLLDQFWLHYFSDDKKAAALNTLALTEPVDFKAIKKQYRRLVMQHHPDRGGNADLLIEVHQAMRCLEQYYSF